MTTQIEAVLEKYENVSSFTDRVVSISQYFLGAPYADSPLIGSANSPEEFVASCDSFDCVTYVETTIALARSRTEQQFIEELRALRYRDGNVSWEQRNHYMADWIVRNQDASRVGDCTPTHPDQFSVTRTLCILPEYASRTHSLSFFPPSLSALNPDFAQSGDIILFGSNREDLDVFHMGLLVRSNDTLLLRHASRKAQTVLQEPLSEFLSREDCFGLQLVRPKNT